LLVARSSIVEASEREVQVPGAVFPYHPSPEFCHDELDLLLLLEFQLLPVFLDDGFG